MSLFRTTVPAVVPSVDPIDEPVIVVVIRPSSPASKLVVNETAANTIRFLCVVRRTGVTPASSAGHEQAKPTNHRETDEEPRLPRWSRTSQRTSDKEQVHLGLLPLNDVVEAAACRAAAANALSLQDVTPTRRPCADDLNEVASELESIPALAARVCVTAPIRRPPRPYHTVGSSA